MPLTEWNEAARFDEFIASRRPGFIFKHSTRCPTSATVREEVSAFADAHPDIPVYLVRVIESRPVSNAIAEKLGVTHESPQAILVEDGGAVWNAGHGSITAIALERAWLARMAARKN